MEIRTSKIKIVISMLIWGSVGLFVKSIDLSSMEIALFRAIIGFGFLIALGMFLKEEWQMDVLKENLALLVLSGGALGINWVLLFEAYKNTTISNAIMSYYLAPVFILVLSRIIFKEQITIKGAISIVGAMIGLFLVIRGEGNSAGIAYNHARGIMYGVFAAIFYAIVVITNKSYKGLSGIKLATIQLLISALVILPIVLFTGTLKIHAIELNTLILLLVVGILHTGVSYMLYFGSISNLDGQTIGILSYIDPIFAILTSALLLGENITGMQVLGGIFIIGCSLLNEL